MVARSEEFVRWLKLAGIDSELTRRIVIEVPLGGLVTIYVELYGSEKMLSVEPPEELRGAVVRVLDGAVD